MSSYLYRLGRLVARCAKTVLALWLLLAVLLGALTVSLGGKLQNDFTIPGTESQQGLDALTQRFPEVSGTSAQLVFVAPEGEKIADHRKEVTAVLDEIEKVDHVATVTDPLAEDSRTVSDNGRDALATVQFDLGLDELPESVKADLDEAAELPDGSSLELAVGGDAYAVTGVHVSATEAIGLLIALLVLAITFGSLLAAGLPILTALLGVAIAMAGIFSVAAVTTISATTPTLALMIGLAVGIDYALFVIARHRSQLATGLDVEESIARAVATAGSAVIFAGVTVIIALCGLVVAGIPFLAVMGYAAASAVLVAVLVALTAVPALLAVAGERLRPKPGSRAHRREAAAEGRPHAITLGARWVRLVTKVPAVTVVVSLLIIAVLAIPARDLALGLNDNGSAEPGSSPRETYDLISRDFGPGYNAPLFVTADIIDTTDPIGVMDDLGASLEKYDGVQKVALATPNRTADLGLVVIYPDTEKSDPATADLVEAIRADHASLEKRFGIRDVMVTGQTAVAIDVSARLSGAILPFGAVVVGLSLILLMVVFRSIAVPLKATLGYVLSVAASFGVVAAVFEWGWGADLLNVAKVGPVIAFFPIILMGVLFGLAMDYEVFLVSRMREDFVHSGDARRSVDTGFAASARVVTAAAVIMIAVFAAFVPNGDPIVKPMALGLTVGVLVDAFLVRMTLVPAVLALLGDRAWWLPRWLDRRLPVLDVEGEALVHHLEHSDYVAVHGELAVRARQVTVPGALAPLSLELRPAGIGIIHGDDPVARSAALAALTGRLGFSGKLVVLDRLLPEESGSVRARAALVDDVSEALRLTGSRRLPRLVAIDSRVSLDSGQLAALSALTSRGATVLLAMPSLPAVPQVADALALAAPDRSPSDLTAASAADLETVR
ncbi:RND superfamily putative drug exporter [Nocardioides luteus]|uniref:RND transporter n=1 Tax=Nocardioides luteus TaxID=1844 RepID=A0ABQ5SY41_9ACTN|nr:MMPL family transporter [Nocardioides luteus]MDR7312848.1 RND superfamily putative drug exporter [Nocardioides luteus]GGR48010.1 RND transporter [Nocardioides luteus]GLJ69102.1 RND transporter [Nocardioides luteus]